MIGYHHGAAAPGELDERDSAIVAERMAALDEIEGPRVGDYVEFPGGITRRIAYIWAAAEADEDYPARPARVQTSDNGSYHLGHGYVSMSGSLYVGVDMGTLSDTGETREAWLWIFHHDYATAHNGVDFQAPMRVYRSTAEAPTS